MNHLEENGMSYFEHLRHAWYLSACYLVHGIFPNKADPHRESSRRV